VNDVINRRQPVGSLEDTEREEPVDTFAYYFGALVKRLRKINPKCRLFFVTIPRRNNKHDELRAQHAEFLHQFAEKLGFAYVLDFFNDVPVYDDRFYSRFFMGSHMNAAGYLFTARVMASYIDYIIRSNWDDFVQIPFVRTNFYNKKYK
ncbi:MAG: SGNH/GDSL hydrolase family protein, partial [Clostridia bacterium]|nr:SGNH/GDSL hydrolase family protein [Clostridia bacterium]